MHIAKKTRQPVLAGRFEQLVEIMPPQAIRNDAQHRKMLDMIDRLMSRGKLTQGQALYLETLVQLVEAYEAEHHAIDVSREPSGTGSFCGVFGAKCACPPFGGRFSDRL